MKVVKSVAPYQHKVGINFKTQAYEAWLKVGGQVTKSHYPPRLLHGFFFCHELPTIFKNKKEARLRFVEPVSISFDTFPDHAHYEIIPFIWDCWPCYFEKVVAWFRKHDVRTAIFTSSQTAERMQKRLPEVNIMYCPEGIDVKSYPAGAKLTERSNVLFEIGKGKRCFIKSNYEEEYKKLSKFPHDVLLESRHDYISALCNSQITVNFPQCDMVPEKTGGIETLTQRFWESMLTRSIVVGRAPQELIDLIGYNPVIEMDKEGPIEQIKNISQNIGEYQEFVDRNRRTALYYAPWEERMKRVLVWLESLGYIF